MEQDRERAKGRRAWEQGRERQTETGIRIRQRETKTETGINTRHTETKTEIETGSDSEICVERRQMKPDKKTHKSRERNDNKQKHLKIQGQRQRKINWKIMINKGKENRKTKLKKELKLIQ